MIYALPIILALIFSFLFCRYLSNPDSKFYIPDHPNKRSLHKESRPRNGGFAILSGFFIGWLITVWIKDGSGVHGEGFLWSGLIVAIVISFLDDKYSLRPGIRFIVQCISAILLIFGGFFIDTLVFPIIEIITLGWFSLPFTMLFIVWMMNLYNFMDGMDGFSGGMGAFGFGFLAIFGWLAGETYFVTIALLIAAANIGFLIQNYPAPKAKIFMGDVGAVPMGFLVASLSLWGTRDGIFEFWVPVFIFSPFIIDATVTMFRRGLKGKTIWEAHHSHYYQRLVRSGWNHKKTVLAEYLLMVGVGTTVVYLYINGDGVVQAVGLALCCIVYVFLSILIDKKTSHIKWD